MSDLPVITMVGGLVDLPELRFTPSGVAVCNFRLAGKKRVKDAQGQWTDGDPIYMSVVCWRKMAENVAESLTRKGQRVTVTGNLEQQWWDGKDGGGKQSKFQIIADSVALDLTFSSYDERAQDKAATTGGAPDPWAAPPQVEEPPF
jgi:single-strand DNA-binding protein